MRSVTLTLALFFLLGNAWGQGAGQGAYEHRCSRCHGSDATGGESGPNIVSKLAGRDDTELEAFIRTGRPASGMPAFNLPPNEMASRIRVAGLMAKGFSLKEMFSKGRVRCSTDLL